MNATVWSHIVRTAVVGTERSPLPAGTAESFGLNLHHDPAQATLEALATATLVRKAGWRKTGQTKHIQAAAISPVSAAIGPSPSAFPAVLLDEWLTLLAQHHLQIPPEYLPELLDRAERDLFFWEKLRPVLGVRGTWLAAQNPVWQELVSSENENQDWFTASFETRKRLLAAARRERPLVTLAWLEKTWPEESNDHRLVFLTMLKTGLSLFDEDFLEKALATKNREVRFAAAELLASLPESRCCAAWAALANQLKGFIQADDLTSFLNHRITDLEDTSASGLFSLTDGKEVRSARQAILQTLLRLLPPAVWGFGSPFNVLRDLFQNPALDFALPALLEATARHRDAAWAFDWLRTLNERPDHSLWRSQHLYHLLSDLDDPVQLQMACFHRHLLADGQSASNRVLTNRDRLWPTPLLQTVLVAWVVSARSGPVYLSPAFRAVLDQAALHCQPDEAEALCQQLLPDGSESFAQPWQQGWDAFSSMVRTRRRMHERMHSAKKAAISA